MQADIITLSGLGSARFAGLGDGDFLSSPIMVNGNEYTLAGAAVPTPDGWYVMSPSAQEFYVIQNGGQWTGLPVGGVTVPLTPPTLPNQTPQQQARPTFDYVRSGDVVRVSLVLPTGVYFGTDTDKLTRAINAGISAANLTYINSSGTPTLGGTYTVDVQPNGDFSHLADIASIIDAAARSANYAPSVPATGAFVSQVEQTGGKVKAEKPPMGNNNNSLLSGTTGLILGAGAIIGLVLLVKE